jgi:translation initiation factor 1
MRTRVVFSTGVGRICDGCGWPAVDCRCSKPGEQREVVPARLAAKLRIEKQGRAGKCVTVIDGLPRNTDFLADLAGALKKACATGGTVRPGAVELAGDVRDRVRTLLAARGFQVKG